MDKRFFEEVGLMNENRQFPLGEKALEAFLNLKEDVESSVVCAIDESQHLSWKLILRIHTHCYT